MPTAESLSFDRWVWPDIAGASERIVAPFGNPTRVVPRCNWSDPDHEVSLSDFQKLFTRAPNVGRTTRETAARIRETLDIEVATEFYTVGKVGKGSTPPYSSTGDGLDPGS